MGQAKNLTFEAESKALGGEGVCLVIEMGALNDIKRAP
jgi:hypothetical protein